MPFALDTAGTLTEIPAAPITLNGIQYPASIFTLWSDAERAALGIYPITDDAIPAGKVATDSTLERDGDLVRRHWTLTDAVPQVVLSALPVAFRRALRNTPAPTGDGHALAYVLAALSSPGYEDAKDAFEYMVRAERQDLIALGGALGFTVEQIDGVLDLAATYPGADAVYGPAP